MSPGMIDSHAHLTSDAVYGEVDALLARAQEAGVTRIVNICTDAVTLERGLLLAQKYSWIKNAAATTPHDVDKEGEAVFPLMEQAAKSGHLVAVGESGLDYYYEHSPKELQQAFFVRYLQLATACRLPIVIHCREAFADLFSLMDTHYAGKPAILHCFTGTVDEAKEVLKRGMMLSLSGIVTFKKSEALREVAKLVPLDHLLIETDTPYLAPQSHRGKTNEPAFLAETARFIAEVKGVTVQELVQATADNARRIFQME